MSLKIPAIPIKEHDEILYLLKEYAKEEDLFEGAYDSRMSTFNDFIETISDFELLETVLLDSFKKSDIEYISMLLEEIKELENYQVEPYYVAYMIRKNHHEALLYLLENEHINIDDDLKNKINNKINNLPQNIALSVINAYILNKDLGEQLDNNKNHKKALKI